MPLRAALNFLITGGARGIGRGLTTLLLDRGHNLYILDHNATELAHVSALLSSKHPDRFASQQCDLRSPSAIAAAAKAVSTHFGGRLDVLINNAAYTAGVGGTALATLSLDEWNANIETNLTAPMLLSQACLPMLRKGGSIIHMSSTRARQSEPDSEGYATTKAGLLGLTHAMAVSLAPDGVRVNAVLPGWISVDELCKNGDDTGRKWEDSLGKEDHEWHLTGRVGKVEDVLKAVEYLVDADFVTGTEIVVDGGVTKKMVYPE